MEAAHRTALAKGEVGIRERKPVPTLKEFAEKDFLPFVKTQFAAKRSTIAYYLCGVKHLLDDPDLAGTPVDQIAVEKIAGFIQRDRRAEYEVSTINRHLQILRRMLRLTVEWGKTEKAPPPISLLSGENRRERVLNDSEELAYIEAATGIGERILGDYHRALEGVRAAERGQSPVKPEDPYLLRDAATILLDCGLRPEKCYRLRWEHVRGGALHVPFGKTASARRSIPMPQRAASILEMRRAIRESEWVFPAPTHSGHIEQSTLKKRHVQACKLAKLESIPIPSVTPV